MSSWRTWCFMASFAMLSSCRSSASDQAAARWPRNSRRAASVRFPNTSSRSRPGTGVWRARVADCELFARQARASGVSWPGSTLEGQLRKAEGCSCASPALEAGLCLCCVVAMEVFVAGGFPPSVWTTCACRSPRGVSRTRASSRLELELPNDVVPACRSRRGSANRLVAPAVSPVSRPRVTYTTLPDRASTPT